MSWLTEGPDPAHLAVRVGPATAVFDVDLTPANDDAWQLEADGLSLVLRPTTPPIASHDAAGQLERQDQVCEAGGRLRIDGRDAEIACLGWRSLTPAAPEFESGRFLAAWLDPQAGFSLTALRPRKARGHEADVVAAAIAEDPPPLVVDPRLSTTYSDQGTPTRAGLELWLEPEGQENAGDEAPLQYPRRAAGEVTGAALDWHQGDLALHASLLHWHSHNRDGAGVYLLGRRR